ncbi:MAG: hypothetical protein M1828_001728 [Chrysothrix sp. TS-e1954]|nr:MAG: hypothetical protein M1828_001728 [Chrysothrix sp. TS-e1954]
MSGPGKLKRGPSVLVTDSRDATASQPNKPQRPNILQRPSTRLISVDNILQYASEVPSGQRRGPGPSPLGPNAQTRPQQSARMPSGRQQPDPSKLGGRMMPQHMPARSSKVSEKLVLLPETQDDDADAADGDSEEEEEEGPPRDEEAEQQRLAQLRPKSRLKQKSLAEKMPKATRTEKLPRVTAYCTAQAYKMQATAEFVRKKHGARTKLYDDCLYTVYHLPLLAGNEGYRIQSSPVLKSPGGKAVLDEEIERNERHEYREGFFGEEQYGVRGPREDGVAPPSEEQPQSPLEERYSQAEQRELDAAPHSLDTNVNNVAPDQLPSQHPLSPHDRPTTHLSTSLSTFAEMFIFSYGVVVCWNLTARQEKDILADLAFSSRAPSSPSHNSKQNPQKQPSLPPTPLAVRPLPEPDFETEEFHFCYDASAPRPRVFNDMITLRSGDHMIKLAISHAIAQSTKLSSFEERMAVTMESAQYVPRTLALKGELGLRRQEVVKILGRLFVSRVDVNLSSNMLDSPPLFWDSIPTLLPLYTSFRQYLEIQPRIQVLNERCRVFLDLAEILSEGVADRKMSRLTWIIIVLIVVSIAVTMSEVFLRFGILSTSKAGNGAGAGAGLDAEMEAGGRVMWDLARKRGML